MTRAAAPGPIHTFRFYRLIGRATQPISEVVDFHKVRGNNETMLFMIACTLLQMLGLEKMINGYKKTEGGYVTSTIFAAGIPLHMKLSQPEAWLLNYAFFNPVLRRSGATCADYLLQLRAEAEAGGGVGGSLPCTWDPAARKVV